MHMRVSPLLCAAVLYPPVPVPRAVASLQLLAGELPPLSGSVKGLLANDSREAIARRALKERDLLEPNTQEMKLPTRSSKANVATKGKKKAATGGGFGSKSSDRPISSVAQQALNLRSGNIAEKGFCLVPGVLSKESAHELHACVKDELAAAYAAVEDDPATCLGRFNVPIETMDDKRGYLLLPLVDEKSANAGVGSSGPLVRALRELLVQGAPLANLFLEMCGGGKGKHSPELYDLVGLRTEAGASRQPIHSDTPWQKTPALFCAFIALTDVRYEQGTTTFLPGTHTGSKGPRKAFNDGQFDPMARDKMLSEAESCYTMLKAGDAVFFNMNTLHAGTANFELEDGGGQRLLFILTFRNRKAKSELGHLPNLRFGYRDRGISLEDIQAELAGSDPFAGVNMHDGKPFGDGIVRSSS